MEGLKPSLLQYYRNRQEYFRNSLEDRQYRLAWQTVNEVSGRKSTSRAKLKIASQEERLQKWKEHFKNLLGNPSKITEIYQKQSLTAN